MSDQRFSIAAFFRTSAIGVALMTLSIISLANDTDRITQLENEIQQLKKRLSNLEKTSGAAATSSQPKASTDGWKNLANWRSVKKGMSQDEVRAVLGEPAKVKSAGAFTFWSYTNGSEVTFYDERLYGWNEPR